MLVRNSAVAGSFYPANVNELKDDITNRIDKPSSAISGDIVSLVIPHAGYVFSGDVAASAYTLLTEKAYQNVVVISPSHRESFNYSSIQAEGCYNTPLGEIAINTDLCLELADQSPSIKISDKGHTTFNGSKEHALEVHLPFLQVSLPGTFKLIPIVMGRQSWKNSTELGQALAEVLKDSSALIIASSDLSHFHSDKKARQLDGLIVDSLENYNAEKLFSHIQCDEAEACGYGPMIAAMTAASNLGAEKSKVLDYATSGDSPYGDRQKVVGYVSAAFYKQD